MAKHRMGLISRAALLCAGLYAAWVLLHTTSRSAQPALHQKGAVATVRSSPRKVLQRPTFFKRVPYKTYKDSLPELLAGPAPHYVLFVSGTVDGSTSGMPWCGDCFVAAPIVKELVAKAGGSVLEVDVGSEDEWHSETHALRLDQEAPVKYIPTLYHWSSKTGPGARISSQLTADEEVPKLKVIVANFLKETAGDVRSVVTLAQQVIESKGKKCAHC